MKKFLYKIIIIFLLNIFAFFNVYADDEYFEFTDSSEQIVVPQNKRIFTKFIKSFFSTGQLMDATKREANKPGTYIIGLHFPKIKRILLSIFI